MYFCDHNLYSTKKEFTSILFIILKTYNLHFTMHVYGILFEMIV